MEGTQGKYPTIVEDLSDNEAFIVTSWRWGENLGSISVTFDEDGLAAIGATTPTTPTISHVGELTTFLDLVEEVKKGHLGDSQHSRHQGHRSPDAHWLRRRPSVGENGVFGDINVE